MSRSIIKNIKSRKGREQRFLLHSEMNNLEKDNDRYTHRHTVITIFQSSRYDCIPFFFFLFHILN